MGKQALDAPRGEPQFKFAPDDLVIIGLDTEDGPEHDLWDKRAKKPISMGLVHDIIDQGILEPVIVRKNGSSTEVVAGRQRVKAARKANEILEERYDKEETPEKERLYIRVPCIKRAGDAKAMIKIIISENANRENLDLLESAYETKRAIDRGCTEEECATAFGVNRQVIRNRVQLLDASKEVIAAIREGKISATGAMKLAVLSHEEQAVTLQELIASGDTGTVAAARAARVKGGKAKGHNGTEYEPPGKRILRKIVESESATEALDPLVIKTLKWQLGLTPASQIKGLAALVAAIEAGDA